MSLSAKERVPGRAQARRSMRRARLVRPLLRERSLDALVVAVDGAGPDGAAGWLRHLLSPRLPVVRALGAFTPGARPVVVLPGRARWTVDGSLGVACRFTGDGEPLGAELGRALVARGVSRGARLGVVGADQLRWSDLRALRAAIGALDVVEVDDELAPLRAQKDPDELQGVSEAVALAERGLDALMRVARVGTSLRALGGEVQRSLLADGAIDSLVLFSHGTDGVCSPVFADPSAADRRLRADDVLIVGVEAAGPDGCWAEHARILTFGRVDAEFARACRVAEGAIALFEHHARPGVALGALAGQLETYVRDEGFALGHTLGHGIGSDLLEWPPIARAVSAHLRDRMALALHPHVVVMRGAASAYLADVLVVEPHGARVLSRREREPWRAPAVRR